MNMKAVIFDLDDTLLRDDRTISDYTVRVLREAAAKGIHVIPASGRARHSMERFVKQLGCASLYVSCNGAEIWTPQHELVSRFTMDAETAREVGRFATARSCYAQTYDGAYFYYSMHGKWADAYAEATMLSGVYVGDLNAWITQPTCKVLLMDDARLIAEYLPQAREQFAGRLSVSCSKPWFLEFNPLQATKGNALKKCGELLGFRTADAVAFGDSLNDLSMLTEAGLGVAVANAREDIRSQVTVCCRANTEDGVAHFIEDMLHREEAAQ